MLLNDQPAWSVPCFYVHRRHWGQSVSGALLEAAAAATRMVAWGGRGVGIFAQGGMWRYSHV